MRIAIADAEGQLTELVKLAGQGEDVVLTQDGLPSVRLKVVLPGDEDAVEAYDAAARLEALEPYASERAPPSNLQERRRLLDRLQEEVRKLNLSPGPDAARSQDFLYDEDGLPK